MLSLLTTSQVRVVDSTVTTLNFTKVEGFWNGRHQQSSGNPPKVDWQGSFIPLSLVEET